MKLAKKWFKKLAQRLNSIRQSLFPEVSMMVEELVSLMIFHPQEFIISSRHGAAGMEVVIQLREDTKSRLKTELYGVRIVMRHDAMYIETPVDPLPVDLNRREFQKIVEAVDIWIDNYPYVKELIGR